jgi:hypothetical protein
MIETMYRGLAIIIADNALEFAPIGEEISFAIKHLDSNLKLSSVDRDGIISIITNRINQVRYQ